MVRLSKTVAQSGMLPDHPARGQAVILIAAPDTGEWCHFLPSKKLCICIVLDVAPERKLVLILVRRKVQTPRAVEGSETGNTLLQKIAADEF